VVVKVRVEPRIVWLRSAAAAVLEGARMLFILGKNVLDAMPRIMFVSLVMDGLFKLKSIKYDVKGPVIFS
jgi:hypothetical protein